MSADKWMNEKEQLKYVLALCGLQLITLSSGSNCGSVISGYSHSILSLPKDSGGEAHMSSKNSSTVTPSSPEYVYYTSKLTYPTHPLIFQSQSS